MPEAEPTRYVGLADQVSREQEVECAERQLFVDRRCGGRELRREGISYNCGRLQKQPDPAFQLGEFLGEGGRYCRWHLDVDERPCPAGSLRGTASPPE